nr:transmembrane emp24 domain-containing protein p24delta9-like [Tanacetum cinerariifolium]
MACFMVAKQNPPAILTVEFDWRSGLATKDWTKVAKRGQLEELKIEEKHTVEEANVTKWTYSVGEHVWPLGCQSHDEDISPKISG